MQEPLEPTSRKTLVRKDVMNTRRHLVFITTATVMLFTAGHASARPAPTDNEPQPPAGHQAAYGRTDQQFWGSATWLNPYSGLNLDRSH
jgi:hypothetical protein